MTEFDELLDDLAGLSGETPEAETTEAISAPAKKSKQPTRKAKPEATPTVETPIRRGNERLVERQCARWMFHTKGVYCKTCGKVW